MIAAFVQKAGNALRRQGYVTQPCPELNALLYAFTPQRYALGFARVQDHFLFMDWEDGVSSRLGRLLELYARFQAVANRGFRVPHALRLQIPNLALIAVAPGPFPPEVVRAVRGSYLSPWYGGEAGQLGLVELDRREVILHPRPSFRYPGSMPLTHAAQVLREVCQEALMGDPASV